MILQIIRNSDEHLTAEDIYKKTKEFIPDISLGTVYRNLKALEENKYIKQIAISNDKDCFDKTLSEHHHLYCLGCKKLFDIPNIDIESIIKTKINYKIISHQLLLKGYCHDCERKENYGIKRK